MTAEDRSANGSRAGFRAGDRRPGSVPPIAGLDPPAGGATAGPLPDPLGLSHELRTPLTTILGGLELMLEGSAGPLSGAARACLSDIQGAGRRLQRRIEDLVLLLDIRERPGLTCRAPIDLVDLLCSTARNTAGLGTADLEVAPQSAPLIVDGDRLLLQRMSRILIETAAAQACDRIGVVVEPAAAPIGGRVLRLSWPGFDPGRLPPMDAALIEQILRLHGASGAWQAGGMQFQWHAPAG